MSRLRLLAIVLLILATVGAGLWAWRPSPATPRAAVQASPRPLGAPATVQPVASVRVTAASSAAPAASAASAVPPASLAARVDAWSRSGDPHDAMQAYQAIFKCLLARRRAHAANLEPDAPGEDAAALCDDLRSDQVQRRVALLEQAARAGEVGAAENFIQEGPGGNGLLADLGTRDPTPPTPDWLARRDDYIERGLAHCDAMLAVYLGTFVRQRDTNASAATAYWQGRLACPGHPATLTVPLAEDARGQAWLDSLLIDDWQR